MLLYLALGFFLLALLGVGGYFATRPSIEDSPLPPMADGLPTPENRRAEHLLSQLRTHLNSDECIEAWVYGTYEGESIDRRAVLVVTAERILAYAAKLSGYEQESIPLRRVASVRHSTGINETLEIARGRGSVAIDYIGDGDAQQFHQRVQSLLA